MDTQTNFIHSGLEFDILSRKYLIVKSLLFLRADEIKHILKRSRCDAGAQTCPQGHKGL